MPTLSKDLLKQMQLQMGFLHLPTRPQEGTLLLPHPQVTGEKAAGPSPCVLPGAPFPVRPTALRLWLGAWLELGMSRQRGEGPAPGAKAVLELRGFAIPPPSPPDLSAALQL